MKNIFVFLLAVVVLSGCSKDEADSSTKNDSLFLVKKATTIYGDEKSKIEITYEYSGNKLLKIIDGENEYVRNIYTGNLITEIQRVHSSGNYTTQLKYDSENRLSETIFIFDDYKSYTKYSYSDGKIEYKTYSNSSYSEEFLDGNGIYYLDSRGNIKKQESFTKGNLQRTTEYTLDDKNSIFKNVIGFNPIINTFSSVTNNVTSRIEYNSKGEKISDVGTTYTYNDDGYPVSCVNFYNGKRVGETFYTY